MQVSKRGLCHLIIFICLTWLTGCPNKDLDTFISKSPQADIARSTTATRGHTQNIRNLSKGTKNAIEINTETVAIDKNQDSVDAASDRQQQETIAAQKKSEDASKWLNHWYAVCLLGSGFALTVGIAATVITFINGGKMGYAVGGIALGASGIGVFTALRNIEWAQKWVVGGLIVAFFISLGYMLYDRFWAHKELQARGTELAKEESTTQELVTKAIVSAPEVLNNLSNTAQEMVDKAQMNMAK